jgi:hypothetical protein
MIKIEGSISQRHGSADPDPHQNVMDPQHWYGQLAINVNCELSLNNIYTVLLSLTVAETPPPPTCVATSSSFLLHGFPRSMNSEKPLDMSFLLGFFLFMRLVPVLSSDCFC